MLRRYMKWLYLNFPARETMRFIIKVAMAMIIRNYSNYSLKRANDVVIYQNKWNGRGIVTGDVDCFTWFNDNLFTFKPFAEDSEQKTAVHYSLLYKTFKVVV